MFQLPTTVQVDGKDYNIRNKGDFRVILDCFNAINDTELDETYRILTALIIFYEDIQDEEDLIKTFGDNLEKACTEMFLFFTCNQPESNNKPQPKLVDWVKDEQILCSAINQVANTEVRSQPYIHWWTFMGYYMGIGESTFATVVGIRHKIITNTKLMDYEKKFKRENPQFFVWDSKSIEQKEAEDYIRMLWDS